MDEIGSIAGRETIGTHPYLVKRVGSPRSGQADARYLRTERSRGYWPNHPGVERLCFLIGARRANVVEVVRPHDIPSEMLPDRWQSEAVYFSRDAASYSVDELPQPIALDAEACLFVFNVLLRNWDGCVLNRSLVRDLPVLYDFGEALNPALYDIETFARAISTPHRMGHFCETYRFAAAFRPRMRVHLERAVAAFCEMRPTPAQLAATIELPGPHKEEMLAYLDGVCEHLDHDIQYMLRAV